MFSTIGQSTATNSSSNRWTRISGKWPRFVVILITISSLLARPPCFFGAPGSARLGSAAAACNSSLQQQPAALVRVCKVRCHVCSHAAWHLLVIPGCPVRSAGDTLVFEAIPDPSGAVMTQPHAGPDPWLHSLVSALTQINVSSLIC